MEFPEITLEENDRIFAQIAKGLAIPTRIAIIKLIIREKNAITLDTLLAIHGNLVNTEVHLKALIVLGLVKKLGIGKQAVYSLNLEFLEAVSQYLGSLFKESKAF